MISLLPLLKYLQSVHLLLTSTPSQTHSLSSSFPGCLPLCILPVLPVLPIYLLPLRMNHPNLPSPPLSSQTFPLPFPTPAPAPTPTSSSCTRSSFNIRLSMRVSSDSIFRAALGVMASIMKWLSQMGQYSSLGGEVLDAEFLCESLAVT